MERFGAAPIRTAQMKGTLQGEGGDETRGKAMKWGLTEQEKRIGRGPALTQAKKTANHLNSVRGGNVVYVR